jgi:hypothetical protein
MEKELPLWIVSRIKGSRAEQIATVSAMDAAGALARLGSRVNDDLRLTGRCDSLRA